MKKAPWLAACAALLLPGCKPAGVSDSRSVRPQKLATALGTVYVVRGGRVWQADYRDQGKASRVEGIDRVVSVAAIELGALALRSDGRVWTLGAPPEALAGPELTDIVQISAGVAHFAILRADGRVFVRSFNPGWDGAAGCVSKLADVEQVAAGRVQTLTLKRDGSLWSCGESSTNSPDEVPVRIQAPLGIAAIEAAADYAFVQTRAREVWAVFRPATRPDGTPMNASPKGPLTGQVKTIRRHYAIKTDGTAGGLSWAGYAPWPKTGPGGQQFKTFARVADIAALVRSDFKQFAVLSDDGTVITLIPQKEPGVEIRLSIP